MTSEFFLDDKRFLGKIAIKPDHEIRDAFFAADPDDVKVLFAMTLSLGMQADYAGLIEKHQRQEITGSRPGRC